MNPNTGILIVNLGSPDSTSVADVRKYLGQFLMDKYVIDAPWPVRKMIVSGFILPFRPKRTAHAYRQIWWEEGSPLVVITRRVRDLLRDQIDNPVEMAMRCGNPSFESGLKSLIEGHPTIDRIRVIAMYPHYAMSTFGSTVVEAKEVAARMRIDAVLEFVKPFYDDAAYIDALCDNAREYLDEGFDHLLVSYHGLPERHLKKTDPTRKHCLKSAGCCDKPSAAHDVCYRHQVFRTTQLFVERLEIPENKYSLSFQSRLGKDAWLTPFTVTEAVRLAESGVKKLLVICPSFVSDCLETLEEIGLGVKKEFISAGGTEFHMIPCLNEHPRWIDALVRYSTDDSLVTPTGSTIDG
jgi:ferrochelatase